MSHVPIEQGAFRRLLVHSVGLPPLLMILLAAVLIWQILHLLNAAQQIEHADEVIAQAHQAQNLLVDMETGQRGYLVSGRPLFLEPYNQATASFPGVFAGLQRLVADSPQQQRRLDAIFAQQQQWAEQARREIALRAQGKDKEYLADFNAATGKSLMDRLRTDFTVFIDTEDALRRRRSAFVAFQTHLLLAGALGLALLLGIGLGWTSRRQLSRLSQSYEQALGVSREQAEELRRQAAVLEASEEQTRLTFEQAAVGIAQIGADFQWLRVNPKLCEILGYTRDELFRCSFEQITHPDDLDSDRVHAQRLLAGEISNYSLEKRNLRKDGSVVWIHLTVSLVRHPSGEPKYFICILEDITERKRLENQLLQAQKLESVGRLAGGVAHDFNNLLTVMLGFSELMQEECVLEETAQRYLDSIHLAAEKASDLTRQMLAFARQQVIEPRIVELNDLIRNTDLLLRRLIGEHIELVMLPRDGLHPVKVDPGQFEQILVNLVVNARDAMPDGGKILLETNNVVLDAEYAQRHEGVVPGEYVMLAISDTGAGMDEAVRLHIFEPFYTTKEKGRGTGLGLATVYGIVKQAGGHIWFYSESGAGTTFKIYLPRTSAPPDAPLASSQLPDDLRGSGLILVVEDESAVRALAAQALRGRGYEVLEATNGEEAMQVVAGREQEIALLITDVVMPQMSGKELADRLLQLHPVLKVLYASGYTENTIVHHGVLEPGVTFLSKPYTPTTLVRKVHEVLNSS